jgi:hypothetical protein
MTTAVPRQNRTLIDAIVPYRGIWVDIATVIVGSLVIAAFAQLKYTLPTTAVPITGQTFAVLLVAATVGSKRGGLAAVLYLEHRFRRLHRRIRTGSFRGWIPGRARLGSRSVAHRRAGTRQRRDLHTRTLVVGPRTGHKLRKNPGVRSLAVHSG